MTKPFQRNLEFFIPYLIQSFIPEFSPRMKTYEWIYLQIRDACMETLWHRSWRIWKDDGCNLLLIHRHLIWNLQEDYRILNLANDWTCKWYIAVKDLALYASCFWPLCWPRRAQTLHSILSFQIIWIIGQSCWFYLWFIHVCI